VTRVLLVDDERAMVDTMVEELTSRHFDTVGVTSADEAVSMLARGDDFDVLVTDVNMRGISGVDLCARVVDSRPDVPVIVITAFGSLETAVATLRAGAFDFLVKPSPWSAPPSTGACGRRSSGYEVPARARRNSWSSSVRAQR